MHRLSDAEQAFVENQGLFFERFGLPRIGGRILAHLLLAEEPLTLDQIAASLKVSKASVSTNMRHFQDLRLVDVTSPLGERKSYYQWSPQAWERRYDLAAMVASLARAVAEQGLAAISSDCPLARTRMEEAIAFADYMQGELERARAGWLQRLAQLRENAP